MSKTVKRWLVCVLSIVMALSCLVLFAACGENGKSAYEIAVDNGFVGTEQEWLASLNGQNGQAGQSNLWHTGNGLPSDVTAPNAKQGDFYINLNTNSIYRKGASAWEFLTNINDSNNISKWDGTIPGWTKPNLSEAEIIKNRPVSYVVNEDLHTINLYNVDAFVWFAYRAVLGKQGFEGYTVNLYCDVDLDNQMWIPIGLGARANAPKMAFKGTFNGNGHTIYNLNSKKFYDSIKYGERTEDGQTKEGYYIAYSHKGADGISTLVKIPFQVKENRDNGTHTVDGKTFEFKEGDEFTYGLFAKTYNATIRNLNIKGVKIDMPEKVVDGAPNSLKTDSVGAIVGFAGASLTVENCTVGQFEHDKTVGYMKNCTNNLDIDSGIANNKVGGIVGFPGRFSNMVVENCINNGELIGQDVGGIMAWRNVVITDITVTMTIRNCTNNGNITATQTGGGIIGYRYRQASAGTTMFTIQNCTNRGDIIADTSKSANVYIGGLIGRTLLSSEEKSMVVHSNNSGNLVINEVQGASKKVYAGGIIGNVGTAVNGSKKGQLTLACGNNGNILNNSGNTTTLQTSTMTDENDKICIGYVDSVDIINKVYLVNIGKIKVPTTPAA